MDAKYGHTFGSGILQTKCFSKKLEKREKVQIKVCNGELVQEKIERMIEVGHSTIEAQTVACFDAQI